MHGTAPPARDDSVQICFRSVGDHELAALDETDQLPPGTYGMIEIRDDGASIAPEWPGQRYRPVLPQRPPKVAAVSDSPRSPDTEAAGGVLRINSELGVGTSVQLILPTRPHLATSRSRSRSARVVILGDNAARLDVLTNARETAGIQAVSSTAKTSAVRLLRTEPIDALVLDGEALGEDHRLLRTAAAPATPVLGVIEVTGASSAQEPLTDDDLATLTDGALRLLDHQRQDA